GAGEVVPEGLEPFAGDRCLGRSVAPEVGHIPDQGRAIVAGRDDRAAVGRECDGVDGAAMAREPAPLATGGEVPDVDRRAAGLSSAADDRGEETSIAGEREGAAIDLSTDRFEARHLLAGREFPEDDRRIERASSGTSVDAECGQESAVWRERGVV